MLRDKENYLSTLVDISKKKSVKNDIDVTILYINRLKDLAFKLGKKIFDMIYVKASHKEKIIFKEAIINEKSANEIIKLYPEENFSRQVIYNVTSQIQTALAKIKLKDNDIYELLMKKHS
nr:MAG TPA: hypothetical protein [Caudoviricetes sp.]